MKINDGQLDEANKRIRNLEATVKVLSELCGSRFDLLKEVASCGISQTLGRYHEVQIPVALWETIREETDEHEVTP